MEALCTYAFPGNVRELENILERALAFANDGVIEVADLALKGGGTYGRARKRKAWIRADDVGAGPVSARRPVSRRSPPLRRRTRRLPPSLPDYLHEIERDVIRRALTRPTSTGPRRLICWASAFASCATACRN